MTDREDPWVLHGGSANHDARDGGCLTTVFDIYSGVNVTITDNGDGNMACAGVDDFPVRKTAVSLGASAAVNRYSLHAFLLKNVANVGGIDGFLIPSYPYFGGYGHLVSDGTSNARGHASQCFTVFEE